MKTFFWFIQWAKEERITKNFWHCLEETVLMGEPKSRENKKGVKWSEA